MSLNGTDDGSVYSWAARQAPAFPYRVSGAGHRRRTFSVTVAAFIGTARFTASLSDRVNTAVTQVVNIKVSALPPANPTGLSAPRATDMSA